MPPPAARRGAARCRGRGNAAARGFV